LPKPIGSITILLSAGQFSFSHFPSIVVPLVSILHFCAFLFHLNVFEVLIFSTSTKSTRPPPLKELVT
jgi:hypothetical protein